MTLARLLLCTLALAPAACATQMRTGESTLPSSSYELCSDPEFQCTPASLPVDGARPIQVDTNMSAPASARAIALS
jgi:hypothetical protein